ncbi:YggS family pyridoxal phosphate-dependent enzyme [Atopobiaceae bacterium 24-176]
MKPVDDQGAYREFLAERKKQILSRIDAACARVGRDPEDVQVFAVSKTVGPDEVVSAMAAGYTCFAENRPQELVRKLDALKEAGVDAPRFDMIGNLQKNKVNAVLGRARLIQSVSSVHLADAISRRAQERGIVAKVLFEVNVSGEATKSGFAPDELAQWSEHLADLPGIEACGLMTMAPAHEPAEDRATFKGLRELRDSLETETGLVLPVLSCGMSDDFEIAVEEGSTLVRLGRVVFDPDYTPGA